jgi:hypothetical protein
MNQASKTAVFHVDRNTVVIAPAPGWTVTIFNITEGKFIDALVTDGEETIKLSLEGPDASMGVVVSHDDETNQTRVTYVEKDDGQALQAS